MSEYGIIGDADSGIELPKMQVDPKELTREKQMARFSKSKEFKMMKEHLESRIEYYRHFLPGGKEFVKLVDSHDMTQVGEKAVLSSTIIQEFQGVIDAYERAAMAVKESNGRS